MPGYAVHTATAATLDVPTLYAILRLRSEVFVVEQDCVYLDIDGRDLHASTTQIFSVPNDKPAAADGAGVVIAGCLRVLAEPDGAARIGRVCVAAAHRRRGVADRLLARAVELVGDRPARLNAQLYATAVYARHGFATVGEPFDEDGIPHILMTRQA